MPNAQHAVRQGKLLAKNIVATLRGREPKPYVHHSLGTVATLGLGHGIFQYHRLVIKGFPAWLMHRGYHVLAVPTWERKIRVLPIWLTAAIFGRDIVSLALVQDPRRRSSAAANPGRAARTAAGRVRICPTSVTMSCAGSLRPAPSAGGLADELREIEGLAELVISPSWVSR